MVAQTLEVNERVGLARQAFDNCDELERSIRCRRRALEAFGDRSTSGHHV
jgi:hypothetical protein